MIIALLLAALIVGIAGAWALRRRPQRRRASRLAAYRSALRAIAAALDDDPARSAAADAAGLDLDGNAQTIGGLPADCLLPTADLPTADLPTARVAQPPAAVDVTMITPADTSLDALFPALDLPCPLAVAAARVLSADEFKAALAAGEFAPTEDRLAVILHFRDRVTPADIASTLGVPQEEVERWLADARRLVAVRLDPELPTARCRLPAADCRLPAADLPPAPPALSPTAKAVCERGGAG